MSEPPLRNTHKKRGISDGIEWERMKMVRSAEFNDLGALAELAALLWQNHSAEDLLQKFSKIMSNGASQFFLLYEKDLPVGFAQCQLRHDYVEGTETTPVGYIGGHLCKRRVLQPRICQRIIDCVRSMGKKKRLP